MICSEAVLEVVQLLLHAEDGAAVSPLQFLLVFLLKLSLQLQVLARTMAEGHCLVSAGQLPLEQVLHFADVALGVVEFKDYLGLEFSQPDLLLLLHFSGDHIALQLLIGWVMVATTQIHVIELFLKLQFLKCLLAFVIGEIVEVDAL